ncbi:MAG: hypothetical protein Q7T73_19645 [Beijerinckiaceae bacterium]|nr:hypothetical protein [Beijerinckiaceae bacterium]
MADDVEETVWTAVIARSLAFLCLDKAAQADRPKFKDTLVRVDFLEALGLPTKDAAVGAGSTLASVNELKRLRRNKANGKKVVSKKKPGKR